MAKRPLRHCVLRGCVTLAATALLAVCLLFGFLWLEHRSALTLPTPSGPFAIGRTIYDWRDPAHVDTLAPLPGTKRELLVWIWYPAASPAGATGEYVPPELRPSAAPAGNGNIWTLLTRDVSHVRGHSIRNAAVSPHQRSYPLVIFRAGASASVVNYTTLAEDLASHGYVVVGFDAPYRTTRVVFPDGRIIGRAQQNNPETCVVLERSRMERCARRVLEAWAGDIGFVLDRVAQLNASDSSGQFTGRIDMSRVGVFGHSFGGATAAQFCHDDARCRAGIDIDGAPHGSVVQEGVRQPFMFLLSDHENDRHAMSVQIKSDIQSIYDHSPRDRRLRVAIRGAFHLMFSDDPALLKSSVVRGALRLLGKLRIDARRQLEVTAFCVHTFFDAYLTGSGASLPVMTSPLYPEIQVLP